MFTYFKMKRNEWKVKAKLYGFIIAVMDNQAELIAKLTELIASENTNTEKGSN